MYVCCVYCLYMCLLFVYIYNMFLFVYIHIHVCICLKMYSFLPSSPKQVPTHTLKPPITQVEGSFWGVTEFKANVLNLLESLQKSKRAEQAKEKLKKYEATPAPNRAKRRELDRLTK